MWDLDEARVEMAVEAYAKAIRGPIEKMVHYGRQVYFEAAERFEGTFTVEVEGRYADGFAIHTGNQRPVRAFLDTIGVKVAVWQEEQNWDRLMELTENLQGGIGLICDKSNCFDSVHGLPIEEQAPFSGSIGGYE